MEKNKLLFEVWYGKSLWRLLYVDNDESETHQRNAYINHLNIRIIQNTFAVISTSVGIPAHEIIQYASNYNMWLIRGLLYLLSLKLIIPAMHGLESLIDNIIIPALWD
jgi:hypothetical protein